MPQGCYCRLLEYPQLLKTDLVQDIVCAWVLHLHHNICMQEVGLYHVRNKWGVFLLEHNGHDVVAYVSLPLELDVTDKEKSVARFKISYTGLSQSSSLSRFDNINIAKFLNNQSKKTLLTNTQRKKTPPPTPKKKKHFYHFSLSCVCENAIEWISLRVGVFMK